MILAIGVLVTWLLINTNNPTSEPNINNQPENQTNDNIDDVDPAELMSLTIFTQDTTAAETSDCGITRSRTIQVLRTAGVADASLRYLFDNELSTYSEYDSVVINNQIARVNLASNLTPAGAPLSSLGSCQSQHLTSVLQDTLEQYGSISSVELYSPSGLVQF